MARYDNRRYSAEMPPGYGPRNLLKFLLDTALDGVKDADLGPKERWRLFVHRERLSKAAAKLTGPTVIEPEPRAELFYQALESILAIAFARADKPCCATTNATETSQPRHERKETGVGDDR